MLKCTDIPNTDVKMYKIYQIQMLKFKDIPNTDVKW